MIMYFESSPFKKHFPQASGLGEVEYPDETLAVAIFTSVTAWKGNSGISPEQRERITRVLRQAKHSIVISFGSPYVLRHFGESDMLIAAYDPTEEAQHAVIRCLTGEKRFHRRLPVKLMQHAE